ncbi:MAG: hypothetical protein NWR12_10805, partial [Haliea sp.]|nr:hypothetical protein [Haliea sp.]
VIEQTEQSIEYAVSQLPEEFNDASYIWQLSSSCGLFDTNVISVHLFFWLTDPLPDEDLRLWAYHTNIGYGSCLVDRAVFNPVQPHYIANPSFVGLDDPIIGPRLGFHEGSTSNVTLNIDRERFVVKRDGRGVTGSPIEGIGYDAKMASLGDADGCKGFNDVLVSAVASYVSSAGGDYAEQSRDDLKAAIGGWKVAGANQVMMAHGATGLTHSPVLLKLRAEQVKIHQHLLEPDDAPTSDNVVSIHSKRV